MTPDLAFREHSLPPICTYASLPPLVQRPLLRARPTRLYGTCSFPIPFRFPLLTAVLRADAMLFYVIAHGPQSPFLRLTLSLLSSVRRPPGDD